MRKILTILILFLITIIGANYLVENYMEKIKNEKKIEIEKEKEIKREKISKEKINNKIDSLRKRFSSKGLIQKGNTYFKNQQNELALEKFLLALKKNKDDKKIIQKIGDTYFEMKDFINAYKYYEKLIGSNFIDPNKIVITYLHTLPKKIENFNFEEIYKKISSFKLDKDDTFFYKTSVECIFNKNTCQSKFKNYTKNYSGKNKNILFIKEVINNYDSFQVKEQYLLDTQIALAIFKAKVYGISNILSRNILKEKPNYLTAIKILAKGNFEIGNYKEAKKQLLKINKINAKKGNPDDPNVNYMLGIININLHEYILSNIYFIKALKSGYKDKAEISRRLIYNYYLADSKEKMISEFKNLIENFEGLTKTDFNLAIYYTIINGEKKLANKWTSKALQLFPKEDNFYGYKGWIYKEKGEFEKAQYYLKQGLKLNFSNPLINLNMGILEVERGNLFKAKIFLKNTIRQDANGDFGKSATKKLEQVLLEEENIKNEIEKNIENF